MTAGYALFLPSSNVKIVSMPVPRLHRRISFPLPETGGKASGLQTPTAKFSHVACGFYAEFHLSMVCYRTVPFSRHESPPVSK